MQKYHQIRITENTKDLLTEVDKDMEIGITATARYLIKKGYEYHAILQKRISDEMQDFDEKEPINAQEILENAQKAAKNGKKALISYLVSLKKDEEYAIKYAISDLKHEADNIEKERLKENAAFHIEQLDRICLEKGNAGYNSYWNGLDDDMKAHLKDALEIWDYDANYSDSWFKISGVRPTKRKPIESREPVVKISDNDPSDDQDSSVIDLVAEDEHDSDDDHVGGFFWDALTENETDDDDQEDDPLGGLF
jgi:hypothetical protein